MSLMFLGLLYVKYPYAENQHCKGLHCVELCNKFKMFSAHCKTT